MEQKTRTVSLQPLTVCRTDGQLEFTNSSGVKELNQPTVKQQDSDPDKDGKVEYYRRIEDDELKAQEWKRKLGATFKQTLLRDKPQLAAAKDYTLKEFPEGYTLWEHIKYDNNTTDKDGKKAGSRPSGGKHAKSGYERQDAYLYGHPQGRHKRFRSPAEFFLHLHWLAVDREGNPNNCICKCCRPKHLDDPADMPIAAAKALSISDAEDKRAQVKKDIKPAANITTIARDAATSISSPRPASVATKPAAAARPTRSQEAIADGDPKSIYLYRPGELVWFNHGINWRLGVIGRRGAINGLPRYLVQPLSNPLQHQPEQIIDQESSLRPWLAWSAPTTTNPGLNEIPFEQVPWARVAAGELDYGRKTDAVVDGSILAAKTIDASYSLYDRNENALVGPNEVQYNAMFLGAEKVWVGEPVRLRVMSKPIPDTIVLVIQKLIERTTPEGKSSVTFVGDVYKHVEMPSPYQNRSQWPIPDLPPRMVADLRFRNETADNAHTGIYYEWRLLEPSARKELGDIRGRWYETRTLLPTLRGVDKFKEDMIVGKLGETGEWMNGRRDNNKTPEQRRKNRRDTVGTSVPEGFKISRGLDGLPADDKFPNEQAVVTSFDGAADIDQFMDLDGGAEFYA